MMIEFRDISGWKKHKETGKGDARVLNRRRNRFIGGSKCSLPTNTFFLQPLVCINLTIAAPK